MALPSGYTQLEYIQSNGTQYIDTGFKPSSQNVKIAISFAYTADHSSSSLFGAQKSQNFLIVAYGNPTFYVGTSSSLVTLTTALNTDYEMVCHANNGKFSVSLNGKESTANYSGTLPTDYALYLFANNATGTTKEYTSAKVYSCKIYDNNTLVRDYIPCKNASGTVGMWDNTNRTFYASAKSGAFIAGPAVVTQEPHNTNISGTAREIESGTVLIGGVLREIESGLVLVGGVAREIGFDSSAKNYTVTITGSGAKDTQTPYACLVIDLNVYVAAQTIELPAGTVVSCRVGRGTRGQAAVLLNGTAVAETAENYGEAWYDYTVNGNTTISLEVATGAIIRITTS